MRYSKLFAKTQKGESKEDLSINAKFLTRGGFVDQLMSGSYTLLPLGLRVVSKIEKIIREEIDATGAQEVLMPLLHPKEVWNETGRWDSAAEVMYQFKKNEKEYALSFTHEEIVLDLVRKHSQTYKDYPIKIYHFSTKFRNELRAKSGVLRGREFLMKDLYSLHASKEDFDKFYEEVSIAYFRIFERLGFEVKKVEASGGVFTDSKTHEFQVLAESGEDTIYFCDCSGKTCDCKFAQNKEIYQGKEGDKCPECDDCVITSAKAIEVGNIFPFGTTYSEKMNVTFMDEKGQRQFPMFGSYGIGLTRAMGVAVELFHDDRGIIWPKSISPYAVYLIDLTNSKGEQIYNQLKEKGIEVLFDDREGSAGEKFATADLLGIPYRLVVSEKTGEKIEFKERQSQETELLSLEEVIERI